MDSAGGSSNKSADNLSWTEAESVWKGLIGTPELLDLPAFSPEEDAGTGLSASDDVPALCAPASTGPSTTPIIGESGAAGDAESGFAQRQLRRS